MHKKNLKENKDIYPMDSEDIWFECKCGIKYNNDLYNLLDNTDIICGDWKGGLTNVGEKDFVFFDPPYTRKFQTYSPYGVFGEKEHIELSEWFIS